MADTAWLSAYEDVMKGRVVSPRGQRVREIDHATTRVNMHRPVVRARPGLSYKFMAAEALWIIDGRDDVEFLAQHVARMRDYSDDGRSLAGAYGPRITKQLSYVVQKLREDRDTRQAALTIWTPNPMPSKDVPCTLAMTFQIREDQLDAHVFMRSSDVWMGLPYDIFSFSMVAEWVRLHHNLGAKPAATGTLFLTAASSHVYEKHWDMELNEAFSRRAIPEWRSPDDLRAHLTDLTISKRARWWE